MVTISCLIGFFRWVQTHCVRRDTEGFSTLRRTRTHRKVPGSRGLVGPTVWNEVAQWVRRRAQRGEGAVERSGTVTDHPDASRGHAAAFAPRERRSELRGDRCPERCSRCSPRNCRRSVSTEPASVSTSARAVGIAPALRRRHLLGAPGADVVVATAVSRGSAERRLQRCCQGLPGARSLPSQSQSGWVGRGPQWRLHPTTRVPRAVGATLRLRWISTLSEQRTLA